MLSLYVPPFQILGQWTDFYEIWYTPYATEGNPTANFQVTTIINNNEVDKWTFEVEATLATRNLE
jgi:hypothetical protein